MCILREYLDRIGGVDIVIVATSLPSRHTGPKSPPRWFHNGRADWTG